MMYLCGNEPRCAATIFSNSPRGFQMAALFPKSSSLWFLILILYSLCCRHLSIHRGRKGQMSRLYRSLAADLFISLHQTCQCHSCVIDGLYLFSSLDCFSGIVQKSALQPPVSFWGIIVLFSYSSNKTRKNYTAFQSNDNVTSLNLEKLYIAYHPCNRASSLK